MNKKSISIFYKVIQFYINEIMENLFYRQIYIIMYYLKQFNNNFDNSVLWKMKETLKWYKPGENKFDKYLFSFDLSQRNKNIENIFFKIQNIDVINLTIYIERAIPRHLDEFFNDWI